MMIHPNVTDPLLQYISNSQAVAREQIKALRRQYKLIKPDDIFEFARFVNVLLGPKLQHEQTYLLDPTTSWISTIHSCSRLGMIRCVCTNFSNDFQEPEKNGQKNRRQTRYCDPEDQRERM